MHGRRALIQDVHKLASRMPQVAVEHGPQGNPVYQVGGKSFVFFRTPRPDAVDPGTGERYPDVIVFWVPSEADKQALVQDPDSPFFTTPHFDGHPSVLVRASRVGELTLTELTEVVQDAWLSRASPSRAKAWLAAQPGHQRALSGGLRQAHEEARLPGSPRDQARDRSAVELASPPAVALCRNSKSACEFGDHLFGEQVDAGTVIGRVSEVADRVTETEVAGRRKPLGDLLGRADQPLRLELRRLRL